MSVSLAFRLLVLSYSDNLPYAYCEQIGKDIRDISDEIPFEIPDSWEWVRLSYIGEIVGGGTPKTGETSYWENGDIPWLTPADMKYVKGKYVSSGERFITEKGLNESSAQLMPMGTVLYSSRAPIGYIAIAENSICTNQGFKSLVPFLKEINLYAYYCLIAFTPDIQSRASGTTFKEISGAEFGRTIIPIPPLSEQHRIVAKIEELLPYIERYGKAEEHLTALNTTFPEALKKSILQEAVQGKLVSQNPDDEPASVLLERIRAEKQALIKAGKIKMDKHESVIVTRDKIPYEIIDGKERCIADEVPFELPESWCWCRLGDILLKLTDGTHSTPKYTESGISFISVKDVSSGKLDFSNCKHISEKEHTELYDRCNPEIGDILLTKVGTTGIPVIVDTDLPFSLFVSVALLKFNQELLYNKYLLYMINSPLVQKQAAENTKGVGNKNWVMRDIANTLIVIPPIDEQHRIVAKIEEIMPYINTITK